MAILCAIRYPIDPFQPDGFKNHPENLIPIIPHCGGHLVGYFLPHEGTNEIARGLVAFDSLVSYQAYKTWLKSDEEAIADAAMIQAKRIITGEQRNFVELIVGGFHLPRTQGANR